VDGGICGAGARGSGLGSFCREAGALGALERLDGAVKDAVTFGDVAGEGLKAIGGGGEEIEGVVGLEETVFEIVGALEPLPRLGGGGDKHPLIGVGGVECLGEVVARGVDEVDGRLKFDSTFRGGGLHGVPFALIVAGACQAAGRGKGVFS
jgi:hypothetical protein